MSYGRIRRGPMAADHFTQIRNALFRDPCLSAKAKGIFGLISTHREGWGVTPESIAACMADGVSGIKSGLQELERFGYLVRDQPRRPNGTMGPIQYYITDQPSSEPVVENHSPGATCENVVSQLPEQHLRRSEPVVDFPLAVEPLAADRPHKKTSSKKISEKNTPTPLRPSMSEDAEAVAGAPTGGGGGGDAPQQQEQNPRAVAFVDSLPYRGRLPGRRQREHLIERVAEALADGWPEWKLRQQLVSETDSAKSLSAVYRHRLAPENLPMAPVLSESADGVPEQRPGPVSRPKCPECHRPLRNATESKLCRDCREEASA